MTSTETSLTEKVKTVQDILKKVGTRLVKKEDLTPLLEKKAAPAETKTILSKNFEPHQYTTLIEYLAFISSRHIISPSNLANSTRDSGKL